MFHNTKNLPNLTHLYVLYASNILAVYSKNTLIMLFAPTSTTSILLCCFHIFHARTPTNIYKREREREKDALPPKKSGCCLQLQVELQNLENS